MSSTGPLIPDAVNIGKVSAPSFARLPDPASIFAARSTRLKALAAPSELGPYLIFLSRIADVQHEAQAALPPPALPPAERLDMLFEHGLPPTPKDQAADDESFQRTLNWVIDRCAGLDAPAEAEAARLNLATMNPSERLDLARAAAEAAYPIERLGESLYVSAALQVHMTRLAAQLPADKMKAVGDGVCPACGGAPVASVIVGWPQAQGSRFCCCSLCATMWNYVRIKCTACGATKGIAYKSIEGGSQDVAAETCETCRSYVKHLHHDKNPLLEPLADDAASYGLDILLQQDGWRRSGVNPFLVG